MSRECAVWPLQTHLWLNGTVTRIRGMQPIVAPPRKNHIKSPHSGMKRSSRRWPFPAAKSNPLIFSVDSIGRPHSFAIHTRGSRESQARSCSGGPSPLRNPSPKGLGNEHAPLGVAGRSADDSKRRVRRGCSWRHRFSSARQPPPCPSADPQAAH